MAYVSTSKSVRFEGVISSWFQGLAGRYTAWRAYRATYRELDALSDKELSDIGLSRYDIAQIARQAQ